MKTRLLIITGVIAIITIPISTVLWTEYGMVCNNAVVDHLQKYSNVFDESITYDTYGIKEIGSPFGVHSVNLQECVDFILEKRASTESELSTIIEILFGDKLQDGLVPVIFTEVTTYAETLDEIMVWNFEIIGHSADDKRVVWDTLPQDKQILYEITNDDGQDISIQENIISIPWDIHAYKMDCGFFQTVTGESAHPTLFKIKNNTNNIFAKNSRIGIYPNSNGEYSFEFASIFPNYVSFPEDAVEIISQNTRECKLTHNIEDDFTGKYTDGYYTKMTFRFN